MKTKSYRTIWVNFFRYKETAAEFFELFFSIPQSKTMKLVIREYKLRSWAPPIRDKWFKWQIYFTFVQIIHHLVANKIEIGFTNDEGEGGEDDRAGDKLKLMICGGCLSEF